MLGVVTFPPPPLPPMCFQPLVTKELISRLLVCSDDELIEMLKSTVVWRFGKVSVLQRLGGMITTKIGPYGFHGTCEKLLIRWWALIWKI